jgi:hypothetical protein
MTHWYDSTPTIMSADGVTTYINCSSQHFPKDKDSQDWVKKAQDVGEYPSIVHRAHVAKMLEGVDAKAIKDAKLNAETLDVDEPKTGTKEEKEAKRLEKLSTVVPVAEYEKLKELEKLRPPKEEKVPK